MLRKVVNRQLRTYSPYDAIKLTATVYAAVRLLLRLRQIHRNEGLRAWVVSSIVPFLKLLPMVADKLKKEQDKVRESLAPTMLKDLTEPRRALPAEGRPEGELLALMESRQALDRKYWTEGKITGAVYHDKPEYMDLVGRVYGMFAFTNPLHPSIHPATRQMDAEVIQMTLDLYRGGDGSCGAFTTGGTESILMAMKSYREWGKATRGIREPNIVCCHTAHAAFDKGGHYFGITVRKCDTDSEMAVDVDHMLRSPAASTRPARHVLRGIYPRGTKKRDTWHVQCRVLKAPPALCTPLGCSPALAPKLLINVDKLVNR